MKTLKKQLFWAVLFCILSTGVMAQDAQKEELKQVVDLFFKGLQNGDTLSIKKTLADRVVLQTAYKNKEGESILRTEDMNRFIKSVGGKNPDDIWEEHLLSYSIQVDGNMANVWTPYEFYFNKNFSHCGVNSFQLFHDGTDWKIIYLIDTRRRSRCKDD